MVAADIKNRKREDYPFILDYRTRWYAHVHMQSCIDGDKTDVLQERQ